MTISGVVRDLLDRQILFIGGKGGVGKTTISASLAISAADLGYTCLLVSTDPAHSLSDIFGIEIGDSETTVSKNLTALEIDPERTATAHIATVKDNMKRLVHPRLYSEVDRQLELATHAPGTMEAALLERVAELVCESGTQYDLMIFDTAPSGHTVRLLSLPEIMSSWTDGLLKHRARSGRFAAMLKTFGNDGQRGDDLSHLDSRADHPANSPEDRIQDLLSARRRKFIVTRERLLDAKTTNFLLVLNPDHLSILETEKVVTSLLSFDIEIAALVINRVLTSAISGSGEFIDSRRTQDSEYLDRIQTVFGNFSRVVVPLEPRDVYGIASLRNIGKRLLDS